mmetsp:Transcript_6730/g.15311  ORF Transcript_6730/g.15311 Transcript_6730/m.15311 type:complete len:225 (-) Transcript_6730:266-940(-)
MRSVAPPHAPTPRPSGGRLIASTGVVAATSRVPSFASRHLGVARCSPRTPPPAAALLLLLLPCSGATDAVGLTSTPPARKSKRRTCPSSCPVARSGAAPLPSNCSAQSAPAFSGLTTATLSFGERTSITADAPEPPVSSARDAVGTARRFPAPSLVILANENASFSIESVVVFVAASASMMSTRPARVCTANDDADSQCASRMAAPSPDVAAAACVQCSCTLVA